jgi:hypothetical protein
MQTKRGKEGNKLFVSILLSQIYAALQSHEERTWKSAVKDYSIILKQQPSLHA